MIESCVMGKALTKLHGQGSSEGRMGKIATAWQVHALTVSLVLRARAAVRIGGGPGQIHKVGPYKMDCVRGSRGGPPGNFEI